MLSSNTIDIIKISNHHSLTQADVVAVEEPIEIKLSFGAVEQRQKKSVAITMRTPGNDTELALGFLFTEGVINRIDAVQDIQYETLNTSNSNDQNVVIVSLKPDAKPVINQLERNFYMSSSCGVCGKSSIAAISTTSNQVLDPVFPIVAASIFFDLPTKLRKTQAVFEHTGGLHAAALFDTEGNLLLVREDVGRHNALDKLIGAALKKFGFPLKNYIILVSGRTSFELVQKTIMAGAPILAAIGAPSSLAIKLAQQYNLSLIGFLKQKGCNIYAGQQRINKPKK